jgi:PHD/YefM family antitoxin component YafN of YafNO toxin-antitoxin module
MIEIPSTEFTCNFGVYREIVQREPAALLSHGRPTGYFISAIEYEEMQRLRALSRRSVRTVDLTEEEIAQIASTRMSPEHDHLNSLIEDA